MVTAVKKAHKGRDIIVRIVNPTGRTIKTTLTSGFRIEAATLADLLEQPLPSSPLRIVDRRTIALNVSPKKILTLRLQAAGML